MSGAPAGLPWLPVSAPGAVTETQQAGDGHRGARRRFILEVFFFFLLLFYRRHEMAMPIMIAVVMRSAPRSLLLLPHSQAQRHARQADADAEAVPTSIRLIYELESLKTAID